MVKTFAAADFTDNITTGDGSIQKGMRIPFPEFNINFPTIQVYQKHSESEYQIADPLNLAITLHNNDIVIIARNPFNGTIVIK